MTISHPTNTASSATTRTSAVPAHATPAPTAADIPTTRNTGSGT